MSKVSCEPGEDAERNCKVSGSALREMLADRENGNGEIVMRSHSSNMGR